MLERISTRKMLDAIPADADLSWKANRSQLGRDLRDLGAPIPGVHGPSADEA